MRRSSRSARIAFGLDCGAHFPGCECHALAMSAESILSIVRQGGERLLIVGAGGDPLRLEPLVRRARKRFAEIAIAFRGTLLEDERIAPGAIAACGFDAVVLPLISSSERVHDGVIGRSGSLRATIRAAEALATEGVAVEFEIPIYPARLQDLRATVAAAIESVPAVRSVRFFVPADAKAPQQERWDHTGARLAAAIVRCRDSNVGVRIAPLDGIPLCALAGETELYDTFRFDPHRPFAAHENEPCRSCAVRSFCVGPEERYREVLGAEGLRPYASRPRELFEQRTTPRRRWTDSQRDAASKRERLVFRPTVHCNQDCTFCSANETTANVWADPAVMMRNIARAARTGVRQISFSGGEPTLSPHLARYIRVASRCGIGDIELITNGVLLDDERRVRTLVEAGLTRAFVSLHAHDELLSRTATQKVGDFARTVQAIHHFVELGVTTGINHVITARNYRFIPAFVRFAHREFGGRVYLSFAFVTPQYKVLDDLTQLPAYSEVIPHLRAAMSEAVRIGQRFVVGSRQGIPPCLLGPFRGWSDLLAVAFEAEAEDSPSKVRGARCDECRYTEHCRGVWQTYAAKYGTDELKPFAGPPFSAEEAAALSRPDDLRSFADVPPCAAPREGEDLTPGDVSENAGAAPAFLVRRSRPVRVALFGSALQAQRIAREARQIAELSIDALVSPHANEVADDAFTNIPRFSTAEEVWEAMRPEAFIVASSTASHASIADAAARLGIPALIEKPLCSSVEEAERLAMSGGRIVPIHNLLYARGLGDLIAGCRAEQLQIVRHVTLQSPDAVPAWSRGAIYELAYHAGYVANHFCGGGEVSCTASVRGLHTPQSIRMTLRYRDAEASVVFQFAAQEDELAVTATADHSTATWRRRGARTTIVRDGVALTPSGEGSDLERMLRAFAGFVTGEETFVPTLRNGVDAMRTAERMIASLDAAAAPFDRPNAPRHGSNLSRLRQELS